VFSVKRSFGLLGLPLLYTLLITETDVYMSFEEVRNLLNSADWKPAAESCKYRLECHTL